MGFLYPLFGIAAISIVIPILIHLFNLRKYKRIDFSNTALLQDLELVTRKRSELKHKAILLSRILFVLCLVMAFMQPFLNHNASQERTQQIHWIFLDNSYSMQVREGQLSNLNVAKEAVKSLVTSTEGNQFVLLSNDHVQQQVLNKEQLLTELEVITTSTQQMTLTSIKNQIDLFRSQHAEAKVVPYIFSDFQKQEIGDVAANGSLSGSIYLYNIHEQEQSNLYVDTAYFLQDHLEVRRSNELFLTLKANRKEAYSGNVKVMVNGQQRNVMHYDFDGDTYVDTLDITLDHNGWQNIELILEDDLVKFDDTFRIASLPSAKRTMLVISDGNISPYLQSFNKESIGIEVHQQRVLEFETAKKYNLIILQNIRYLNESDVAQIKACLAGGLQILMFPHKDINLTSFNQQLSKIGAIEFTAKDTSAQMLAQASFQHKLLQSVLMEAPQNIQLPTTHYRYVIQTNVTTNPQVVFSFKDGTSFLSTYDIQNGSLLICASPLDDKSSNFVYSHFFAPIIVNMAMQHGVQFLNAYDLSLPISYFVPLLQNNRSLWHVSGNGINTIPIQKAQGNGTMIYLTERLNNAGFYKLFVEGNIDTFYVAANVPKSESQLDYMDQKEIASYLPHDKLVWLDRSTVSQAGWNNSKEGFPIWKIAVVLALLCLALETYFIWKPIK